MSWGNNLVKLQAHVAIAGLLCVYPLLLAAALIAKLWGSLFCSRSSVSLEGEVAVVTGAAHGLGRAIAIELAKKGCHIAAVDINLPGAESTVKIISDTCEVRAKAYKVNVANYLELAELNIQISADLGAVTVLINNAGVLILRNSIDPDPAEVQRLLNVNMASHFWTKSVFLPKMKQLRKGYIVTISSLASLFPLAYNSAYTASKFAATGHMRALRQELAIEKQRDIHVTTVMPSFLGTNDEVVDIVRNVDFTRLYPLISGEQAARRIVQGMLRHEREIALPGIAALLYRAVVILPASWQDKLSLLLASGNLRKFYKLRA